MNQLGLALLVAVAFLYGLAASHYDVFPYPQLVALKQKVLPPQVPLRSFYSDYYLQKKSLFDADTRTDYDVVFVGDSLTDDADWQALFPYLRSANRGIQGDTTTGLLNRLDSVDATGAAKVMLMIGVNDFLKGKTTAHIFEYYHKIISSLETQNKVVYIQSCLYVGTNLAVLNPQIEALNTQLEQLANTLGHVQYIDINRRLAPSKVLNTQYTYDGVHLTGEGYTIWQQALQPYLVSTD